MKKILFIGLLFPALFFLLTGCKAAEASPVPTEVSTIVEEAQAAPESQEIQDPIQALTVWSAYWDCQGNAETILKNKDSIQTASLFAAYFQEDTLFIPESTLDTLQALRAGGWDRAIYLSVVNDVIAGGTSIQKDTAILHTVLSEPHAEAHARELVTLAKSNGFDGIEIDYEKIRKDMELWDRFLHFEEALITIAREENLGVRIILEPSTPVEQLTFPQGAEYVVMCYNLYGGGTDPGPKTNLSHLASLYDRFRVLPNISFALANGGFDWAESSTSPSALTASEAAALAQESGAAPQREESSGAISFQYAKDGVLHTVWYADSETLSIWAKKLAACAGSAVPISLWRL